MGLVRAFVGFSSTDLPSYRVMQMWKANDHIDFNFTDCQLAVSIDSENESYIKRICRERIDMAGTFIQLIGRDTRQKHKYVRWESEVALEKNCRVIGVNVNDRRECDTELTPPLLRNIGAIFVPLRAKILAYAIENYKMHEDDDWHYKDEVYQGLGL